MSFDTIKIKPNSFKICIAELDIPKIVSLWISHAAGIWKINLSPYLGTDGTLLTDDQGVSGYFEETVDILLQRIGSMTVDDNVYSVKTTYAGMEAQTESVFYDPTDFMLYAHFTDHGIPWGRISRVGLILGFCDKPGFTNGAYYDDIYYDPRIQSIPSLKKQKDSLFTGILQYTGGGVTLNNADGYFESLIRQYNIFGQPFRILFGFDGLTFSEFKQIFEGIVDDYSYDRNKFTLNIIDPRKFLSRKIPIRQFDKTSYPSLSDDNAGKVKPLAWGNIRNAGLVCLNEEAAVPSTYQFYVADITDHPVNSVSAIRVSGVTLSTTKWTHTDGIVYISSAASTIDKSGDTIAVADNLTSITADFNSYSTNTLGLNVLTDMLYIYAGISTATASANYDSTEWVSELTNSRNVGIYLDEEKEISDVIKDVCVAEDGVFLVLDDGRFTFRRESTSRTPVKTILTDEWISDPKKVYPRKEYLTSVKIKYDKNQDSGDYKSYTNTTYESTSFQKYKTYAQKEIETVLTSSSHAYTKSEVMMGLSKDIIPTITRMTKTQNIDLEIMDVVEAEHERLSNMTKYWAEWEINGITKNINKAETELVMRWKRDIDAPSTLAGNAYMLEES